MQPIRISGKHYEVSSFAACVHGALRHWGRRVPYHYVAGLTGAAFRWPLRPGAACAGCREDVAGDERIEFMGHALGFSFERVPLGPDDLPDDLARQAAERAGDDGILLCSTPVCWAAAACSGGRAGRVRLGAPASLPEPIMQGPPLQAYVIRASEQSLTEIEAYGEAVRYGSRSCAAPAHAPLFDLLIGQVAAQQFCPNGRPDGWGCAERAASRAASASLAAARFLTKAHMLPLQSRRRTDLDAAARAHAAVAAELAPYTVGSGLAETSHTQRKRDRYRAALERARELHAEATARLGACM